MGFTPPVGLNRGTPLVLTGWSTPSPSGLDGGTPSPHQNWMGVPPGKDLSPVEVLWDGDGIPPWKGHGTSGGGSIIGW